MVLTSAFTRNPTGKNQHKDCPPADDPRVRDALIAYHRRGLTDRKKISALLLSEHGIRLSESSIARRRRALNLHGSKYNSTHTAPEQIRALVEKYMTAEPTWGPRAIREAIIKDDGVLLTRDRIAAEMRAIDPDGFIERHPQMQKIRKQARGEGAEVEVDPEVVSHFSHLHTHSVTRASGSHPDEDHGEGSTTTVQVVCGINHQEHDSDMQAYPQSYDAGPSYPLMDPSAQSTQMQMPAPAASHDPAASAPFPLAPAHFTTFEAMASRTEPQTHVFVMYDPSRHYASAPQREDTPAAIPSRSPHILPESYMRDGSAPADFDALHALEASASPAPPSDVGGSGMGDDLASYELGNRDGSHEAGSSSSSLRATPARGSKEDSRSRNNNPNGRNQYKDCPPPNDPRVRDALLAYHRRGITDRKKISKLLKEEHGIIMSDTSVSRRRRALDLHGSAHETANTPLPLARLLIHAHMSANPAWGPRAVRKALLKGNGVLFTRDFIADEMRRVDPRGFAERHPHAQKAAKQARQGRRKSVESGQDKDQEHGQEREQDDDDAAMSVSDTSDPTAAQTEPWVPNAWHPVAEA